jgi:hypothetical protein
MPTFCQDLEALDTFVAAHGSFPEMVREHYATVGGDAGSAAAQNS